MKVLDRSGLVFLTGGLILMLAGEVLAGQVYRYTNEKGVLVIDDTVPPQFVPNGYEILDSSTMTLIQRVPRQLSEEELRLRNTDEARARFREEEERRLKVWDESLLLRYSSLDDIDAAEKRAVQDLQIRISILKSNLTTIKSQIEREQQKAADFERRGQAAPKEMIRNIEILRQEIEDTEQSIEMRREEVEAVKASYQRDRDRFTTLLDRVEFRRKGGVTAKP